jgi:carbonic anhydrase
MKACRTVLVLTLLALCLVEAGKRRLKSNQIAINAKKYNGKAVEGNGRPSDRKIRRKKKPARPNSAQPKSATPKQAVMGEPCAYVVLSDLMEKGTNCINGAKFVLGPGKTAGKKARRQYAFMDGKVCLLWVAPGSKFKDCTSFTDKTADVTCKTVDGLADVRLQSNAGGQTKVSWDYEANGPDTWVNTYPLCGGLSQSPLDLQEATATVSNGAGALKFNDYGVLHDAVVSQNGHTFSVVFPGAEAKPSIEGGSLPAGEVFEFAQLHLHWGSDSFRGSEHRLAGGQFPAEIHLVHWNKKYGTFAAAVPMPDGLAVVGFFYQVSAADNPGYASIVSALPNLAGQENNFEVALGNLALTSLIPAATAKDFSIFKPQPANSAANHLHYKGSLTTPACYQSVFWNVFTEKVDISEAQLNVLRQLTSDTGNTLNNNYRPPQPLNGRTVYVYKSG